MDQYDWGCHYKSWFTLGQNMTSELNQCCNMTLSIDGLWYKRYLFFQAVVMLQCAHNYFIITDSVYDVPTDDWIILP